MTRRLDRGLCLEELDPDKVFALLSALTMLGAREREVWVDVVFVGESQVAIARRDRVSQSSVAHCLARAQRKLERAVAASEPTKVAA